MLCGMGVLRGEGNTVPGAVHWTTGLVADPTSCLVACEANFRGHVLLLSGDGSTQVPLL